MPRHERFVHPVAVQLPCGEGEETRSSGENDFGAVGQKDLGVEQRKEMETRWIQALAKLSIDVAETHSLARNR